MIDTPRDDGRYTLGDCWSILQDSWYTRAHCKSSMVCACRDCMDFTGYWSYVLPTLHLQNPNLKQLPDGTLRRTINLSDVVNFWKEDYDRFSLNISTTSPWVRVPLSRAFWSLFPSASIGLCNLKQGRLTPKSDYSVVDENEQSFSSRRGHK